MSNLDTFYPTLGRWIPSRNLGGDDGEPSAFFMGAGLQFNMPGHYSEPHGPWLPNLPLTASSSYTAAPVTLTEDLLYGFWPQDPSLSSPYHPLTAPPRPPAASTSTLTSAELVGTTSLSSGMTFVQHLAGELSSSSPRIVSAAPVPSYTQGDFRFDMFGMAGDPGPSSSSVWPHDNVLWQSSSSNIGPSSETHDPFDVAFDSSFLKSAPPEGQQVEFERDDSLSMARRPLATHASEVSSLSSTTWLDSAAAAPTKVPTPVSNVDSMYAADGLLLNKVPLNERSLHTSSAQLDHEEHDLGSQSHHHETRSQVRRARASIIAPYTPASSRTRQKSHAVPASTPKEIPLAASPLKIPNTSPPSKNKKKTATEAAPAESSGIAKVVELCGYTNPRDHTQTCGATVLRAADLVRHRQIHLYDEWVTRTAAQAQSGAVFAQWSGQFPTCTRCGRSFARTSAKNRHVKGNICKGLTRSSEPVILDRPTQHWVHSPVERPKTAEVLLGKPDGFRGTKLNYILQIVSVTDTYDNRYSVECEPGQEIDVHFLTRDQPGGLDWYAAVDPTKAGPRTTAVLYEPEPVPASSKRKRSLEEEDEATKTAASGEKPEDEQREGFGKRHQKRRCGI